MIPKGFKFAAAEGAVKAPGRLDMGLMACEREASVAAVFTKNTVVAAPVVVSRERAKSGTARAVLVNAGNANACTGERGMEDAVRLAASAASALGVKEEEVLICSTGVIGQYLPVERMEPVVEKLAAVLGADIGPFSESIMTTDTVAKVASRVIETGEGEILITGTVKGAGMIRPDMATMLGFIATDAGGSPALLQKMVAEACEETFNRITIDGDTSTNDTVILMASGMADAPALDEDTELAECFADALRDLCDELARMIVRDGEGVNKVVDITVIGATDDKAAKQIAFTIAESPLVKTAIHGEDPNWGRIAGALGRSGAFAGGDFDIAVGDVSLVSSGLFCGMEAEDAAHEVMKSGEYEVTVTIDEGQGSATVVTCDFSKDYVSINADYRS